jgi:hypothetical protein
MKDIISAVTSLTQEIVEYLTNIQSILQKGLNLFTEAIPSIPIQDSIQN